MTEFTAKVLNSSNGKKVLKIEFDMEDLHELRKLIDSKIKIRVMGYGG